MSTVLMNSVNLYAETDLYEDIQGKYNSPQAKKGDLKWSVLTTLRRYDSYSSVPGRNSLPRRCSLENHIQLFVLWDSLNFIGGCYCSFCHLRTSVVNVAELETHVQGQLTRAIPQLTVHRGTDGIEKQCLVCLQRMFWWDDKTVPGSASSSAEDFPFQSVASDHKSARFHLASTHHLQELEHIKKIERDKGEQTHYFHFSKYTWQLIKNLGLRMHISHLVIDECWNTSQPSSLCPTSHPHMSFTFHLQKINILRTNKITLIGD